MSREEIDGIMNRSESMKKDTASPWKTDWREMAKKTIVKRAYKYWPKSDRLDQAIHHLNTDSARIGDTGSRNNIRRSVARCHRRQTALSRNQLYASLQDIATARSACLCEAWAKLTKVAADHDRPGCAMSSSKRRRRKRAPR
nr:recombinase RecT [Xanthomonas oryzae]